MAAHKLPALQFYPGDWHKDSGVQALNLMERGAWFELLLMMHDSDERGVLLLNGLPMPEEVIALRLRLDNQTSNQILTKLLTYGVASRRQEDAAIICRRMIRDEYLRQVRTEAGKKGGNPGLLNQTPKQIPTTQVNQIPTPSSSSSSSPSVEKDIAANAVPVADATGMPVPVEVKKKRTRVVPDDDPLSFPMFWNAYDHKRDSPTVCKPRWDALPEEARRRILDGLTRYKAHCRREVGSNFQLYPAKFLSKRPWEGDDWAPVAALITPTHHPGNQSLPAPKAKSLVEHMEQWGELTDVARARLQAQEMQGKANAVFQA